MDLSPKPIVVLVVEDEPLIRLSTVESLEDLGFDVIEAADADRALEILEGYDDIAVVFTDVNMPGSLDGLGLAHTVRERWPAMCVIVTSGKVIPSAEDLPECGCYIAKPYEPERVASVMHQLLAS